MVTFGLVVAAASAVGFAVLAWFGRRDPYLPWWAWPAASGLMVVDVALRLAGHPLVGGLLPWLGASVALVFALRLRRQTMRLRAETAALRVQSDQKSQDLLRRASAVAMEAAALLDGDAARRPSG